MIIINNIKYNNYIEMCEAFNINPKEFFEFKRNNISLNEIDLLYHFIPDIGISLETGNYITRSRKK